MSTSIRSGIDRTTAVNEWIGYGLDDLIVQFFGLEKWRPYQPFFLAQGLEKICKAYMIGRKSGEYENLSFKAAKQEIDKIAKSYSHNLTALVEKILPLMPSIKSVLAAQYDGYDGNEIVKILDAAYQECRYPVVSSISESYPVDGSKSMYWDPLYSSALEKFSFVMAKTVLIAAENEFGIAVSRSNLCPSRLDEKEWSRFSNLFWG